MTDAEPAVTPTDGPSARERMRAERAASAKRARLRKRGLLAGAIVALAAAGAVYFTDRAPEDEAEGKPLIVPANTAGEQRTSIVYGKPDAPHTLTVRTALNCRSCRKAERSLGPAMRQLADQGTYKIEYRLAASPDGAVGDKQDRHALNALGAAANTDVGKFAQYLGALLIGDDSAASDEGLLHLAGRVDGLRTPAFDRTVRELTYLPWVNKVIRTHDTKTPGFPSLALDGAPLPLDADNGQLIDEQRFHRLVRERLSVS
ncbi:hypothetical protein SSP35_02_03450 [Streptomyces sp. NBRC 110611]|nr:hypothetical protein SSP35_02_03450 [Streptomyces sp. NBRC 110611]